MPSRKSLAALLLFALSASGCGYTLKSSFSRDLEKEGVKRVYVSPVLNNTYQSGIENVVYNALIKAMSVRGQISIVSRPAEADAVLSGTVGRAQFSPSSVTTGDGLNPKGAGKNFGDFRVATEYSALLECSFILTHRAPRPGQSASLWSASFARTKLFPASNQLGVMGTTSALINESEFERSLGEIAQSMMIDVRESMLARF